MSFPISPDQSFTYNIKQTLPPMYCDAFVFGKTDGALIVFMGDREPVICSTDEDYAVFVNTLVSEGLTVMDVYDGTIISQVNFRNTDELVPFLMEKSASRPTRIKEFKA
jgi:hypothetical protein